MIRPGVLNVIGNGVVVDPWTLLEEVEDLRRRGIDLTGRLRVSDRAHVILPYHKLMDRALEALRGDASLGTTSRGIGPAYADKYTRDGIRVADLLRPDELRPTLLRNIASRNEILVRAGLEPLDPQQTLDDTLAVGRRLEPYIADTVRELYDAWKAGKRILLEGAQGFALDVDQGSYPYVTSSSTGVNGVGPGTGLPPKAVDQGARHRQGLHDARRRRARSRRTTSGPPASTWARAARSSAPRRAASGSAAGSTPSSRGRPCARRASTPSR